MSAKTLRYYRSEYLIVCFITILSLNSFAQSVPMPTDRGRLKIEKIADIRGGDSLYVIRTDAGTPLRGASPWIEKKQVQLSSIRESFIKDQSMAGMNTIRLIWFEAWQQAAGYDAYTNFNDSAEVAHCLEMIEKYVNLCSKYGMYCIINFHSKFGSEYDLLYATQMWTTVAAYFKDRTHVAFETANEPCNDFNGWMSDAEMQKYADIYKLVKKLAPNTMQIVLTPNRLPDSYPTAVDLANKLTAMASIDWSNAVVGYHLYAGNLASIRNLHKKYPALPTENNFPANSGANKDAWGGVSLDGDYYSSQTCEKFGLGWLHWAISNDCNCYEGWYANWPIMLTDALSRGWYWKKDIYSAISEAEANYAVVNSSSSELIAVSNVGGSTCSNGHYLSIPVAGDKVQISINVPVAGNYGVLVRVRSGNDTNSTFYLENNAYEISINSNPTLPMFVSESISTNIDVDSWYATLRCTPVFLAAGNNTVTIEALFHGQKIDYVQAIALADELAPSAPTQLRTQLITANRIGLTWNAATDDAIGYQVFVNGEAKGITTNNSITVSGLQQNTRYTFTVKTCDANRNCSEHSQAVEVITLLNIALKKLVSTTSRSAGQYTGSKAVDGNKSTFWQSLASDANPSITIDLGTVYSIKGISLFWATHYAKNYIFKVSVDSITFKTVKSFANQDGGFDDHTNLNFTARYLLIEAKLLSTAGQGILLSEMEIYGDSLTTAIKRTIIANDKILVYPNPASNQIVLENLPISSETSLFTIDGKMVYRFVNPNSSSHKIDVTKFEHGVYLLRNKFKSQIETRKIVIERP